MLCLGSKKDEGPLLFGPLGRLVHEVGMCGLALSMKRVADRPYPSSCAGCAHGFILHSRLVAANVARKSAVSWKLPFGLQMSCWQQVLLLQCQPWLCMTEFWNPSRLDTPLLLSGIRSSCGWDAARLGHWRQWSLRAITQSFRWGIKLFLWKMAVARCCWWFIMTVVNVWVTLLHGLVECRDALRHYT